MISATTDSTGYRTYRVPQALADVAMELFEDHDQISAVFRLAKRMTWADCCTTEQLAVDAGHAEAVTFARQRMVLAPAL